MNIIKNQQKTITMLHLSSKKVERKNNLVSALIIIAILCAIMIPVIIWGNVK